MANKSAEPLVSVIIPAYNSASYLGEALDSILNQTYRNIEVLVIDDRSTDDTFKIAQQYSLKDGRVKVWQNESNLGISGNRNKGITLATGSYIAWQDADDISLPDRLRLQVEYMESHPQVGICGGYLQFFDESGEHSQRRYATDDATLRSRIFRYSPVAQPAALIRTECFKKVGDFDTTLVAAEDLDMSFRIGQYYQFANLDQVVLKYREHPSSSTFKKLRAMEANTIKIRQKYARSGAYQMSLGDKAYNVLQYVSMYIIPPKLKIKLFDLLRNS